MQLLSTGAVGWKQPWTTWINEWVCLCSHKTFVTKKMGVVWAEFDPQVYSLPTPGLNIWIFLWPLITEPISFTHFHESTLQPQVLYTRYPFFLGCSSSRESQDSFCQFLQPKGLLNTKAFPYCSHSIPLFCFILLHGIHHNLLFFNCDSTLHTV